MRFFVFALFSLFLGYCLPVDAQDDNASLILQSPHGTRVKMIWFLKRWEPGVHGFDLKRHEGIQKEWTQLNSVPIYPSLKHKKDLRNLGSDKTENERVRSAAMKFLASYKIPEMDSFAFAQNMLNDAKFLPDFFAMVSENYDLALYSGFAFIDNTLTRKIDYEYGLFDHETGNLMARATWNYGETPDLNMIAEVTSRSTTRKRGILIMWAAEQNKIKSGYVHGFNIYRDGIRLNQEAIPVTAGAEGYEWFDSTANSSIPNQYAIASQSILDIEGNIRPYTYNPSDHPSAYQKAVLEEVASQGFYFKEGFRVAWSFPADHERFISGFYVEKENMPAGYKRVSPLLDPATRVFVDKSASSASSYIRSRVVAVYKDKTQVRSRDRVFSYFPLREPPAPVGLEANGVVKDKTYTLHFTWDAPMIGDTSTACYNLFSLDDTTGKLVPVKSGNTIRNTAFSYRVPDGNTGAKKFCLLAVGKNKVESKLSDTLVVVVPTVAPPRPSGISVVPNDDGLKIQWQYADIFDLRGFRLFINNKLALGEDSLKKNTRECELQLEGGHNYEFKFQAVTTSNITSELSDPAAINLPAANRKKR